jgi:hypothetical protein
MPSVAVFFEVLLLTFTGTGNLKQWDEYSIVNLVRKESLYGVVLKCEDTKKNLLVGGMTHSHVETLWPLKQR